MNTLRKWLLKFLRRIEGWILSKKNDEEYEERLEAVRYFFYEYLPQTDPTYQGMAIIEGGRFNYFPLRDGKGPVFDFALPQTLLFVVVGGVKTASWEEARLRGVKRTEWEVEQANLAIIESELLKKGAPQEEGQAARVRLLIIKWEESVTPESLLSRLRNMERQIL